MPNTPKTLQTSDGYIVTVDMSLAVALACKGFKVQDCEPLAEDLPGVYIYTFTNNKVIERFVSEFDSGNLLVEPSAYWEMIETFHERYHGGVQS